MGQSITFVRESDTLHDPRAVRIDWRGRKLGCLPRVENCGVSQMMDRNVPLTARIVRLDESCSPWERVMVEVTLDA